MIDDETLIRRIASAVIEEDRAQHLRCQHGDHDMLVTASPGVVVCRLCRTLGVCLWCGLTLPHGACIAVCAKHIGAVQWQARHQPTVEAMTPQTQEGRQQTAITDNITPPMWKTRMRKGTTTSARDACHRVAAATR